MLSNRNLTVVAAVIRDERGRVLMCRRPDHKHMGGLWEFPGGKIQDGEDPERALARELREELGIEVSVEEPLTFAVHREPGMRILLLFFAANLLSGRPHGLEGQAVKWIPPSEMPDYPTPPADAALVADLAGCDCP